MGRKLKIAIIGCGAIFEKNHLNGLLNSEVWEIVHLIDSDIEQGKRLSKRLKCRFGTKIEDISPQTDACLVATPNVMHSSQSIELLKLGFHVISEKPVALNLNEALEISKVLKKSDKQFFIVHQMRYLPTVQYIKKIIEENQIGEIEKVDIAYGNKFGWLSRTNFYMDSKISGGGVLIDLGVHMFDLLISIWPKVQITHAHLFAENDNKPIMDTALSCWGILMENLSFSLRVSRVNQLNNTLRISTKEFEWEISLGGNKISIGSPFNKSAYCKKCIEVNGADPFEKYWISVYNEIIYGNTNSPPPTINEGLKVMSLLEEIWENGEIIRQQI